MLSVRLFARSLRRAASTRSKSVWSCNEWDPLEEVIVGRPELAVVPHLTQEVRACISPSNRGFFEKNGGRLWADSLPPGHWRRLEDEVAELCRVLEGEGVTVRRPDKMDWTSEFVLQGESDRSVGLYGAMPRDSLLIVGDEIIEACMPWRSRFFEFRAFRRLIADYWRDGARWTSAPKSSGFHLDECDSAEFAINEFEPCFDAADFVRAGRDVFGQRSHVTNLAGIEWLRRHLQPLGVRVHRLQFRDNRPMHIDASFCFLRPGVALQNPARPLIDDKIFKDAGWKIYDCPTPVDVSGGPPMLMASEWLSMNTLMLDTKRVLIDKDEVPLQRLFAKLGVTPVPVAMRHCHTIGGGIHCWTADVRRKGKMESYF